MANVPVKNIERILNKEGVTIDGYYVIESIEMSCQKEVKRLGMTDGITEEFDFLCEYSICEGVLTFYGGFAVTFVQSPQLRNFHTIIHILSHVLLRRMTGQKKLLE